MKRPRLQVVVSEPLVEKIEALGKERGSSVSATCAWIIERYFDENPSSRPAEGTYELKKGEQKSDDADYAKYMTLFRAAKDSGII